jgi:hypothetical protein
MGDLPFPFVISIAGSIAVSIVVSGDTDDGVENGGRLILGGGLSGHFFQEFWRCFRSDVAGCPGRRRRRGRGRY